MKLASFTKRDQLLSFLAITRLLDSCRSGVHALQLICYCNLIFVDIFKCYS